MKKTLSAFFSALICIGLCATGHAADANGIYVAPKLFVNFQHGKSNFNGSGVSESLSINDTSLGGGIAAGYDFSKTHELPFRAEVEFAFFGKGFADKHGNDSVHGDYAMNSTLRMKTLLANGYWDITTWNGFTPWLGAGIGLGFIRNNSRLDARAADGGTGMMAETFSSSQSNTVFAGQIGFGCSYALSDMLALDFGYRYVRAADASECHYGLKVQSQDVRAHQLMLGARVTF